MVGRYPNAILILIEFNSIAHACKMKDGRGYPETSYHELPRPAFSNILIMHAAMHKLTSSGPPVVRPLLFDMYERPLPAAEAVMLEPGHHQIIIRIRQSFTSRLTSAGMADSSIEIS